MAEHNEFGKLAEDLAADFLVKSGHKILLRNFRFQHNEIDIISEFEDLIVITEVKARTYDTLIEPQEAVTTKKIKAIVMTADFFMTENAINKEVRFDIISVLPDKNGKLQITHIESAFESFDAN